MLIENHLKSKPNYLTNSNLERRAPDQILKEIVDGIKREKISEDAMEWMDQFEQWIKHPPDGNSKYQKKDKEMKVLRLDGYALSAGKGAQRVDWYGAGISHQTGLNAA